MEATSAGLILGTELKAGEEKMMNFVFKKNRITAN